MVTGGLFLCRRLPFQGAFVFLCREGGLLLHIYDELFDCFLGDVPMGVGGESLDGSREMALIDKATDAAGFV